MAGIDVGEDFLDIATFSPASRRLNLARADLRKISADIAEKPRSPYSNPIASLSSMLIGAAPELRGAITLVDSPRWPRDLDWSKSANDPGTLRGAHQTSVVASKSFRRGREIDAALRALVSALRELHPDSALASVSMFPTPPMNYFGAHLNSAACKPHLRLLGHALFGRALNRDYGPASGGIFTRFMIAGFATYQALAPLARHVYECYPDLGFKLWRRGLQLFSKNSSMGRTAILASRIRVLCALARELGISELPHIKRMDEADAVIVALSTVAAHQQRALLTLENPEEGGFLLALKATDAHYLEHRISSLLNDPAVDPQYDCLNSDAELHHALGATPQSRAQARL